MSKDHNRQRDARQRLAQRGEPRQRLALLIVLGVTLLLAGILVAVHGAIRAGHSSPTSPPLQAASARVEDADLDGDGSPETVELRTGSGGILITDGPLSYRSRAKWYVFDAALGDTDRDGHPEVVALLEGPGGRHLGLIAYFGGAYRERLVSSPLNPPPLALRVWRAPGSGDVIELVESHSGAGDVKRRATTYRWNGFGYTAIAGAGAGG